MTSRRSTKRSTSPSQSQVTSHSVARAVGSSPRRWIGTTGNSWSSAQESGIDWKTEKLAMYFVISFFSRSSNSSGTKRSSLANRTAARLIASKSRSPSARSRSDR